MLQVGQAGGEVGEAGEVVGGEEVVDVGEGGFEAGGEGLVTGQAEEWVQPDQAEAAPLEVVTSERTVCQDQSASMR